MVAAERAGNRRIGRIRLAVAQRPNSNELVDFATATFTAGSTIHPGRDWRRSVLPDRRTPGRLRWSGSGHPPLRIVHQGRAPARSGNKRLKNALFLSAFAALHDPESRAYYDRKRSQGKKHNAAVICLPRRRTDVIYAMLRDSTCYRAKAAAAA